MAQVVKSPFPSRSSRTAPVRPTVAVPLSLPRPRLAARLRRALTAAAWGPRARLRRAERVHPDVVVGRGERRLATGYAPDGTVVLVATDAALHHRAGVAGWSRLGWERVGGVAWDDETGCVAIFGMPGAGERTAVLRLRDRGMLPELAAERVAHTRLGCRQATLDGHGRLFVEVRRRPRTGELVWWAVSDGGFACAGPGEAGPCGCPRGIREQIDAVVVGLRDDLGVAPAVGPEPSR